MPHGRPSLMSHIWEKVDDTPPLVSKNQIKAIKALVFKVTKEIYNVRRLDTNFDAYAVDLSMVLTWAIREQRLHGSDQEDMEFNIKIDGRPLGGRNQVAVGIVPIGFKGKSSESALSVFPIAIANCKEQRHASTMGLMQMKPVLTV
ncbi:uncharacterized protein LOC111332064 [Stylophora pistillata]|uniref:uncharacterized protein LOC111332064 n=1 Tax=Stylophora pistillata TaxID=50429 RepID=UPI000C05123B|nr:uncharacterized protein LOC111332064 [Stylophora pistillata]